MFWGFSQHILVPFRRLASDGESFWIAIRGPSRGSERELKNYSHIAVSKQTREPEINSGWEETGRIPVLRCIAAATNQTVHTLTPADYAARRTAGTTASGNNRRVITMAARQRLTLVRTRPRVSCRNSSPPNIPSPFFRCKLRDVIVRHLSHLCSAFTRGGTGDAYVPRPAWRG
jgi:hypothetical protein